MSMTREEASVLLKMMFAFWANTHERTNVEMEMALNLALSALRPVSREQLPEFETCELVMGKISSKRVEQTCGGCDRCSETGDTALDAGGAHDFRVVGDAMYYCDSDYGWEGTKIKFCPWCGRPLTGNAVDIIMQGLEEMRNA